MSKWYEVKTVEVRHWLVEVSDDETEEDAIEAVTDAAFSDADDMEIEIESEVSKGDLETMKRHTERQRILSID